MKLSTSDDLLPNMNGINAGIIYGLLALVCTFYKPVST